MSEILLTEQASGVTPGAGKRTVYAHTDGLLRVKDSAGVEYVLMKAGGAINGTTIGQTTPAAGSFTTLTTTDSAVINGGLNVNYNVAVIGKAGSGTGGNWRYTDDTGTTRWLTGFLGGVGSTTFSIYNLVSGVEVVSVASTGLTVAGGLSATGKVSSTAGGAEFSAASTDAIMKLSRTTTSAGDGWLGANVDNSFHVYNGALTAKQFSIRQGAPADSAVIDASGNLLVGVTSGSNHFIVKSTAQGSEVLGVYNGTSGVTFQSVNNAGWNAAAAAIGAGSNSATGRSINAGGTINASGADYAEYERNNGIKISKGDVVGFKADGTLTNVYADAVRFAVKSTNPSYVGGDTWGNEGAVGKRPGEPQRITDKAERRLVTEASQDAEAVYETIVVEAGDTDAEWAAKQADYAVAKADFEERLEVARQLVDRIAYSGKVPCNVMGATPGGYIIAVDAEGAIAGEFIADPDFEKYKKAVGRVNRLLPDGRCEVAVIIH